MKVLVVRFSSIGDIVLTTPIIRCIKTQIPDVELHYLTKDVFKPVMEGNPYIDKLILLEDNNLNLVIKKLKEENYDYVADLHNNIRTKKIHRGLGNIPFFSFNKLNIKKWMLVNFKVDWMPDNSIVERYFETVKELNVVNDEKGLDYFVPEEVKISNTDIPMSHWNGYVGCVIGGSYNTKKLPVEQWQLFCKLVPYPVVLLGGKEDAEAGSAIAQQDSIKIYNSCGKFDINESALLVKHAKVIVSNDTGLMHIGAAFQKPVISLWGNTSPSMGMFPYYGNNDLKDRVAPMSKIVEVKGLSCHPCTKLGYKKCPKGHFKCMSDLNMNEVVKDVILFWNIPNLKKD